MIHDDEVVTLPVCRASCTASDMTAIRATKRWYVAWLQVASYIIYLPTCQRAILIAEKLRPTTENKVQRRLVVFESVTRADANRRADRSTRRRWSWKFEHRLAWHFKHLSSPPLNRIRRVSISNASYLVFQVRYAPKVSLRIRSGLGKNGRIVEGSELRFKCRAEANPPNVEYRWVGNARVTRLPRCFHAPFLYVYPSHLARDANDILRWSIPATRALVEFGALLLHVARCRCRWFHGCMSVDDRPVHDEHRRPGNTSVPSLIDHATPILARSL